MRIGFSEKQKKRHEREGSELKWTFSCVSSCVIKQHVDNMFGLLVTEGADNKQCLVETPELKSSADVHDMSKPTLMDVNGI